MSFVGRDPEHVVENLTPESLRGLLFGATEFVIVENPEWGEEFYAQAARLDGESWRVEVRSGGAAHHVGTIAANTDAAYDILRSWAAADGWWQDAFVWRPVDL